MSAETSQVEETRLLDEARLCPNFGYFSGAVERASRLEHHLELGRSARFTAWMARVYLGEEHWADALNSEEVLEDIKLLYGRQGIPELACLLKDRNPKAAVAGIQSIFETANAQHGVLVAWHPTAILRLADCSCKLLLRRRQEILTHRLLSKRILDGFFAPVLRSWGFKRVLL